MPQSFDSIICLLEFGHGGSPVRKNGRNLKGTPLVARHSKDFANVRRHGIRHRIRCPADTQSPSAKIMILIVIRVIAPVLLVQVKGQHDAVSKLQWLVRNKNGLASHIPAAGTRINPPSRIVFAINRQLDRSIGSLVPFLLIPTFRLKLRFEPPLRI